MSSPIAALRSLSEKLSQYRFAYSNEIELQDGIYQLLSALGIDCQREYKLSDHDRPDFFLSNGLVIEVKVDGPSGDVMRQVARYAEHVEVEAVLLVTTKATHTLPETFSGKPVAVHFLGAYSF